MGPTRIVSHFHSFIQIIDLESVRSRLESVKQRLQDYAPQLNNITSSLSASHIKHLETQLQDISEQLASFEVGKRFKRGLIDGLGSIIKSISGNLDYTDALKYDNAISVLKQNEDNLVVEINRQISLNKQWTSHSSNVTDRILENQDKLKKIMNSILDNDSKLETAVIQMMQLLIVVGDDVDNLAMEFYKLQNLLAFIRAKSIHHSVLDFNMYKSMISRLNTLYNKDEVLDISFREYFDILDVGYYYKGNEIVLVIKFPIVYPTNYILYKLSLAPNRFNKIIFPTYPFVAIHNKDLLYIEAECPKYSHGRLCKDSLSLHHAEQLTCIEHLILQQHIHESCHFTSVILSSEAMERLDDHHYVLSFPNLTKVRLTCIQDQYKMLQGSYIAIIPKGCMLQTKMFSVSNYHDQITGHVLKLMNIAISEDSFKLPAKKIVKLNTIDLSQLHSSNSRIAQEEPVTLKSPEVDVIYHTTIPMYILLSTSVLVITALLIRHKMRQQKKIYEESTRNIEPQPEPKPRNPTSLSALFST